MQLLKFFRVRVRIRVNTLVKFDEEFKQSFIGCKYFVTFSINNLVKVGKS